MINKNNNLLVKLEKTGVYKNNKWLVKDVSLEVNKSGAGISSNNSNQKKYRVYKFNPPIKDLSTTD